MIGGKYGRLSILENVGKGKRNEQLWRCRCDCGNEKILRSGKVKRGETKSCGCLAREATSKRLKKHGHAINGKHTSEYKSWLSMIQRCENPKHDNYNNYGGRGIKICERWRESFVDFISDVGVKPDKTHSLERINNNEGYEPKNCRWATKMEQVINQRIHRSNKSGFRGVCWNSEAKKWKAYIGANGKTINLGNYESKEEAISVREKAELQYWSKKEGELA